MERNKHYFASDFHLGLFGGKKDLAREKHIIRWLNTIEDDAAAIYLVGDIFDFWFEFHQTIPKGYTRLMGKIAALTDVGIPVHFFKGNHDMWTFGYLKDELGVQVHSNPIQLNIHNKKILVGHGDGLGPGDRTYKLLKTVFTNKILQQLGRLFHPDLFVWLARKWSRSSRFSQPDAVDSYAGDEKEYLTQYCKSQLTEQHFDYFVFGHRHLPLNIEVGPNSRYINTGEWINNFTYAVLDENGMQLLDFKPDVASIEGSKNHQR